MGRNKLVDTKCSVSGEPCKQREDNFKAGYKAMCARQHKKDVPNPVPKDVPNPSNVPKGTDPQLSARARANLAVMFPDDVNTPVADIERLKAWGPPADTFKPISYNPHDINDLNEVSKGSKVRYKSSVQTL